MEEIIETHPNPIMNPNTVHKLITETTKPDYIATTVKIIFGTFLLVRIIKTSTDLYFTIQDRKKENKI